MDSQAAPASNLADVATAGDALVARLIRGDQRAFAEAWSLYRARLYSFLLRMSGQPALAEDLLQETWLRLAQYACRLEPDTRLLAWLYTVARRLYLSHRRKHLGWLRLLPGLGLAEDLEPPTPYALTVAADGERRLEAALLALPLTYREPLLLVAVDGVSLAEAATILDLSGPALRQRLSRGRALLAQRLELEANR